MMRNPFTLSALDQPYAERLEEILVDDLYRRAAVPVVMLLPVLGVFYWVIADIVPDRPVIGWIFVALIVLVIPRLIIVLCADRIKARFPNAHERLLFFAVPTVIVGLGMSAINLLAAPMITGEQLFMLALIAAGINSIAIISMSASLGTYLLYMVPNIASIAVAEMIGPPLTYRGVFLFLVITNLVSLVVMATTVHVKYCRGILLQLKINEINSQLQDLNRQLKGEVQERMAAVAELKVRNEDLEALNQRMATTQARLLQSEKMASIGQLAAGIAHEINNPITFVRSNLHSLANYLTDLVAVMKAYEDVASAREDGAERRKLAELKRSTDIGNVLDDIPPLIAESSDGLSRVEKIVKDLKKFSNVDRSAWQFIDLHDSIDTTLSVAAHEITTKADVVREYGTLPPVACLPGQINQVFLNLLINAAQSHTGRGTITIRTGRDGDAVWVQIEDTGNGIPADHLARIFDPFFTTKKAGVGPGLGLSVSYNIVQQHGGTLDVTSEVGKGSTFTVRLPIDERPPAEQTEAAYRPRTH
ncbi:MAG TPA: ATP-binding protein [Tahibacter sp.]|uniref:ATP-binding protein n=1 Tax=Tahibacter sp. TaxID=2056211 RepID=UPI002B6F4E34|nr:ATP-binding protein [Tahibacter sp.]HSX59558.1 ATP-binding protein [Tahibacter sp.]